MVMNVVLSLINLSLLFGCRDRRKDLDEALSWLAQIVAAIPFHPGLHHVGFLIGCREDYEISFLLEIIFVLFF